LPSYDLVAAGFSLRKQAQPEGCGYLVTFS